MANLLRQSTVVTIPLGPFLDPTDGVTEEDALTVTVEVSKNNGAFAARNSATAVTHDTEGWYRVELDATDTLNLGPLVVKAQDSASHAPVWREFVVVPANVYDSLVSGADFLEVSVSDIIVAAGNKIADYVLRRTFANAAGSAYGDTKSFRSLLGAIAKLVNRIQVSGTTLTVYENDDTTALGTQTITTSAGADPISALDTD